MYHKIPPYGKPLAALLKSGQRPLDSVNIYTGQLAWQKGQALSISYPTRTLILPNHNSPWLYHWPVQDCDICLYHTSRIDPAYVEEIADCLLTHGANMIVSTLCYDQWLTSIYKKDFYEQDT